MTVDRHERLRRRNRWLLAALALLALLPLLAAVVLYYLSPNLVGGAQTNRGALIEPPGKLASLSLMRLDGRALEAGPERDWRVIMLTRGACGSSCRDRLHLLRQLHARLGRDEDRVRRVLALGPEAGAGTANALRDAYPRLVLARSPGTGRVLARIRAEHALRGGASVVHEAGGSLRDAVLVADPLGNVILLYAPAQVGEPLLDDLRRLLRLSNIG